MSRHAVEISSEKGNTFVNWKTLMARCASPWPKLRFLVARPGCCFAFEHSSSHPDGAPAMAKLPMVQRLAVLFAFQATVAIAYVSIIERSRARDGSFERDGYNFWDMYGEPKHKRNRKANAEQSKP